MDQQSFDARYEAARTQVEAYLAGLLTRETAWKDLYESMRYSLLAGGKRLRPILTLEFARLGGLEAEQAMPVACAVEMVHTYSLIHDDLPCMDDDDLRRGKPTNHKVFGETMAVLAGDALQPEAYRMILTAPELDAERRANCARILAEATGPDGMVGGQVLDTIHSPRTGEELDLVHRMKTSALISAACRMGSVAAGGGEELDRAAAEYAQQLGLAFQIRDDMLDVIGDAEVFGKPIGSDKEEEKITFVDLLGLEGCDQAVLRCTERAKDALRDLAEKDFLCHLADQMVHRSK